MNDYTFELYFIQILYHQHYYHDHRALTDYPALLDQVSQGEVCPVEWRLMPNSAFMVPSPLELSFWLWHC